MYLKLKTIILSMLLPLISLIYGVITLQYNIALNSLYAIFSIAAFAFIHKRYSTLNPATYYAVIIFILLAVFAGKVLNFYSIVPYWDKILHFLSGFLIASIGKQIYEKSNSNTKILNLFILSFATGAAGIWEIYEFTVDGLLGLQSQNSSLSDTMWDMIAGSISAVFWVVSLKIIKLLKSK